MTIAPPPVLLAAIGSSALSPGRYDRPSGRRQPTPAPRARRVRGVAERTAQGAKQNLPILLCPDRADWEDWLAAHHAEQRRHMAEAGQEEPPRPSVRYAEADRDGAVPTAGSTARSRARRAVLAPRFTPRARKSKWSQINRATATRLIEAGRMRRPAWPPIQAAKADGRWEDAYAPPSRVAVPADFQAALDAHPEAQAFFATLTGLRRFAFLFRLNKVKRPRSGPPASRGTSSASAGDERSSRWNTL